MAQRDDVRLIHGDCEIELKALPSASVDVVLTDPPYPHIRRSYGTWTEAEWFSMMRVVVPECMRSLKPTGSAVFILQPNSERVGRMRTWLWEFMAWVGKDWGIVQDAWWWNYSTLPTVGNREGLLRCSLKACVWIGLPNCYRNRDAVFLAVSAKTQRDLAISVHQRHTQRLNGKVVNRNRMLERIRAKGGVTPYNILPFPAGAHDGKHGAGTPAKLCDWWLKYICPPSGTVLDPFSGSGTVALAALKQGKRAIGIEKQEDYHLIAQKRIADEQAKCPLFAGEEVPHAAT